MQIEIKNRWNGSLIFSGDFRSLKLAVEHCVTARISLRAADLRAADLSDANLRAADLSDAPFAVKHLDAKILARIEAGGCLKMSAWHICGTTHCRGGWAVVIAGEAGRTLEFLQGTQAAANWIYAASRPGMKLPNFGGSQDDDEVLADIRRCAALDPLPEGEKLWRKRTNSLPLRMR
jgi:hypothetical protein